MESLAAGITCPKCGYGRRPTDTNPDWQCPSCQIAYAKFVPTPARAPLAPRLAQGGRELADHAQSDGNLFALAVGFLTGMSLREMMAVYWLQSVIIGTCSAIRIFSLDRFDVANFEINDKPATEEPSTKHSVGSFFLLHYGIFHVAYLGFLAAEPGLMMSSRGKGRVLPPSGTL